MKLFNEVTLAKIFTRNIQQAFSLGLRSKYSVEIFSRNMQPHKLSGLIFDNLRTVICCSWSVEIFRANVPLKFQTGTLVNEINTAYKKHRNGKRYKPLITALDNLRNEDNSEKKPQEGEPESTSDGYLSSEVDQVSMGQYDSDSSGNGSRFKGCTSIFSLDFPPSPKVPKGKGKKSTSDVHISEGTSAGDQLTRDSQNSDGMGSDKSEQSPVLLNTEGGNDDAGEINDGGDEITNTVNVMGSEGDEYLPPSGTVAVRRIPDELYFNIVKGRFCGKGGKGELLGIRRKCHFEFVIIKM